MFHEKVILIDVVKLKILEWNNHPRWSLNATISAVNKTKAEGYLAKKRRKQYDQRTQRLQG